MTQQERIILDTLEAVCLAALENGVDSIEVSALASRAYILAHREYRARRTKAEGGH